MPQIELQPDEPKEVRMKHPIKPLSDAKKPTTLRLDTPVAPPWPSYQGNSQFTGTSPSGRVTVYVDPTLDPAGLQNAQDLVNDADRVVTANDAIFGTVGGPVSVIVFALGGNTDGTGGADHMGCDYTTGAAIEVCASYGNAARVSALFEAELSECSMGGNLCGTSTGEGLSRWCAAVISNNALADFSTAPQWAQSGMPDFVNQTEATDQNAVSTGCTMAFLSWLMSQNHPLGQIAPAMVSLGDKGTLAQLYADLTSDSQQNAWPSFQAAVDALPGGITDDDPFGGAAQPSQVAHITPLTAAIAGRVFASILGNVATGKAANQIVEDVRALLVAGPAVKAAASLCYPKSRRLLPPSSGGRK